MKIGIYGGTFNPIHYGHLRTAEDVIDRLSLDSMVFMPSGVTPFDKPDLAKAVHRYKMLKAAIKGNPRFRASRIEIDRVGRSFTVDTIAELQHRYIKSSLYFVLGIDAFLDLPGWKEPDRLLGLTNLVIISRPGFSFYGLRSSPYLKDVSARILKDLDKCKIEKFEFDVSKKRKGYLCNVTGLDISASNVRKLIVSGKDLNYLLPDSVKSYIISNNLYTNKEDFQREITHRQ